jgi:hypothetical protein
MLSGHKPYNTAVRHHETMIHISLLEPQWIQGDRDDPQDQCAHGYIDIRIDDITFVSKDDGGWNVSAAALFMLRTVSSNHTPEESVTDGNFLIPCCGHAPQGRGKYRVIIVGCNTGIDPTIKHIGNSVRIELGGKQVTVPQKQWATAILGFVEQVEEFYRISSPKDPIEDEHDKRGWSYFWEEWASHKLKAEAVANDA